LIFCILEDLLRFLKNMIFIISCEEVYYVILKPNIQRKKKDLRKKLNSKRGLMLVKLRIIYGLTSIFHNGTL